MSGLVSYRGHEGVKSRLLLTLILALLLKTESSFGWILPSHQRHVATVPASQMHGVLPLWAKKKKNLKTSGGSGGFGAPATTPKKTSHKDVAIRIAQQYGGTTAADIVRGTQQRIDKAMASLPSHLQVATQLYQELQTWNARLATLSVLEHANLPPQELDGARRAQEELERIFQEHDLTRDDLHNIFQQITWDASADAKAARAMTGTMSKEITDKVDRACRIVAEAVGPKGRCLDVGCGYGVLVPHLTQCGLTASQIYGVDLSPEMIRNGKEQHRGVNFEASDFQKYTSDDDFDAIIFCSSLHDLPNVKKALNRAASLLRPQGKLVVVHPQGAAHVARQNTANPVMVHDTLPDAEKLKTMVGELGLEIEKEPAKSGSSQEENEGYLAVLVKK